MNARNDKTKPEKRYRQRTNLTLNPRLKRDALRMIAEGDDPGRSLSDLVDDGLRLLLAAHASNGGQEKTPRKEQ